MADDLCEADLIDWISTIFNDDFDLILEVIHLYFEIFLNIIIIIYCFKFYLFNYFLLINKLNLIILY